MIRRDAYLTVPDGGSISLSYNGSLSSKVVIGAEHGRLSLNLTTLAEPWGARYSFGDEDIELSERLVSIEEFIGDILCLLNGHL